MKLKTRGEKIFIIANAVVLILLSLSIVLPIMNIVALSFSSNGPIQTGAVSIFPVGFTWDSYKYLLDDSGIIPSVFVTVFVTIIGTGLSLFCLTLAAYPLSKPDLKNRKYLLLFFVVTMMFSGGLVPSFILINGLGLMDTVWALIFPLVMNVYNMILVKNFMENLPESLYESAKIDGASDWNIFLKITIPLSKPVLATVGLFSAVGFWNSYFPGIMYITSPELKPLQTKLYEFIQSTSLIWQMTPAQQAELANISSKGIESATIVFATLPILLVYPFLQKHFVKGIVVGSDK